MNRSIARGILLMVAVAAPSTALAQDAGTLALCKDDRNQDRQPDFVDGGFDQLGSVAVTGDVPPKLQLQTNLIAFNPENIFLPFDQQVSVSYVYEAAGASSVLGWMMYSDLIARGYININGTPLNSADDTLVDSNGNGVADFHEDLFNIAPQAGVGARTYIGPASRRCTNTFVHNGFTFSEPEVTMGACGTTYVGATGLVGGASTTPDDQGLYPRIPNLMEPADPANSNLGLGHLIFLHADDDTDNTIYNNMAIVGDTDTTSDGIPDYDVSAYDSNGKLLGTNPDPGISAVDRTVDMGILPGNTELVFFMITYYNATAVNSECLRIASGGTCVGGSTPGVQCGAVADCGGVATCPAPVCALSLNTRVHTFFSKSMLNIDLNTTQSGALTAAVAGANPTATRDIGCDYGATCGGFGGWLDAAARARVATPPWNLVLPTQIVGVPRPKNNKMPHVLVGAPSTDPFKWAIGFEDLAQGGDRDFNDVTILINKQNGGVATSGVVSGDISPAIAADFTISKVLFTRDDDFTDGVWTSTPAGECAGPPAARIDYSVAIDCKICLAGTCTANPLPTWVPVTFPPLGACVVTADCASGQTCVASVCRGPQQVELDMLDLGFTGSQLCWKAVMISPKDTCTPQINNINVGYLAKKAGEYSRAAVSPLANSLVYGVYQLPGALMTPASILRTYDARYDNAPRGHLYFKSLYNPELVTTTAVNTRWDSGNVLSNFVASFDPDNRKVYTMASDDSRLDIDTDLANGNSTSAIFPDSLCGETYLGQTVFDVNRDGTCDNDDRHDFRHWIQGWEDKHGRASGCPASFPCVVQSNVKQAWPMGGINLSTAAVLGPPGYPGWWYLSAGTEQDDFKNNFLTGLSGRQTVAYVGTQTGFLEAFNAGGFRHGDDTCTAAQEHRGYFNPTGACGTAMAPAARNYGTGGELFAYLPRKMLSHYVNQLIPTNRRAVSLQKKASLDASPSVADVDLGKTATPPWTIVNGVRNEGAKTVLVSATGAGQSSVFALDITDPTHASYPLPMWEYDLAATVPALFAGLTLPVPDSKGSRHSPPIARAGFVATGCGSPPCAMTQKWIAVVGTDYTPNSGTYGALYLMDLKTGLPVSLGAASTNSEIYAGVVPLQANFGVAGEPTLVDVQGNQPGTPRDGNADVIYVPTTSGRIYRVNLTAFDTSALPGSVLPACLVADIPTVLAGLGVPAAQAALQTIYSSVSVVAADGSAKLYVGTADDPDDDADARATNYYVVAFDDTAPTGACAPATYLWNNQLDPGQTVWGGVTVTKNSVFVTTAVGQGADICALDDTASGKYYSYNVGTGAPDTGSGTDLGTHSTNPSVVFDEHLFMLTADGKVQMKGNPNSWNNSPGVVGPPGSRTLMWDALPNGKMPQ